GYEAILEKLTSLTVPVFVIDKNRMAQISDTVTPQGIIAICKVKAKNIHDLYPEEDELFVVSDAIQDPGNTGTIIRVCDGAGIKTFISLKGSANPFNPKVIRASAGSVFSLDIVLAEREDFLEWCREHNIPILITAPEADKTIFEFDLEGSGALVFGNETRGVSKEIRQEAACSLRIPIYGSAESLNVASTAAITIYEFVRKTRETEIRRD
ncbi:MAG TPA: RNA methyltransferase, partial [Nitrospirae bacterium]|nr:RNA methyltransferase [Nitrospirota bacterium]